MDTTPATGSTDGSAPSARALEFRDEIAGMSIKTPVDADERRWLIAGILLVVVGIVLILSGWFFAGGEVRVERQIPYVLSGGVLGLALVVVGSGLFVRYSLSRYLRFWLVRSIVEERAQTDRQIEALERIAASLGTRASSDAATF